MELKTMKSKATQKQTNSKKAAEAKAENAKLMNVKNIKATAFQPNGPNEYAAGVKVTKFKKTPSGKVAELKSPPAKTRTTGSKPITKKTVTSKTTGTKTPKGKITASKTRVTPTADRRVAKAKLVGTKKADSKLIKRTGIKEKTGTQKISGTQKNNSRSARAKGTTAKPSVAKTTRAKSTRAEAANAKVSSLKSVGSKRRNEKMRHTSEKSRRKNIHEQTDPERGNKEPNRSARMSESKTFRERRQARAAEREQRKLHETKSKRTESSGKIKSANEKISADYDGEAHNGELKNGATTKITVKIIHGFRKAADDLEKFQLQFALGKAEAKDKYEVLKKRVNSIVHEAKMKLISGEEKVEKLQAKFDELRAQLASGKAQTKEAFDEQRKKITDAIHDLEVYIREHPRLTKMYDSLLQEFEKVKIQMEILAANFGRAVDNSRDSIAKRRREMDKIISGLQKDLAKRYKKIEASKPMENFQHEMGEAYKHLKAAFVR